jgi:hypothetical protein
LLFVAVGEAREPVVEVVEEPVWGPVVDVAWVDAGPLVLCTDPLAGPTCGVPAVPVCADPVVTAVVAGPVPVAAGPMVFAVVAGPVPVVAGPVVVVVGGRPVVAGTSVASGWVLVGVGWVASPGLIGLLGPA